MLRVALLQGVLLWVWGLIDLVVWYCLFFWHQDPKNKKSHVEKTRTHSSLPFLFVLFWTTDFVRFDVAVKEEEEAAVAAMDELAEANKEFLQGMGGVVGEEALEYVKFVFIAHVGGTRCVTSNTDTFVDLIDVQVPTTTVAHGGRGGGGGRGRRRRKKSVAQQTVQGCHGHFVRLVRAIGGGDTWWLYP